jgi:hypothetical protein
MDKGLFSNVNKAIQRELRENVIEHRSEQIFYICINKMPMASIFTRYAHHRTPDSTLKIQITSIDTGTLQLRS